jgi:hypothetical protein
MYADDEKSHITAGWNKLMDDGADAAHYYMLDAIEKIENKFGKGYAKEHPELVGAYMNTASRETHGSVIAKSILELRDSIDELRSTIWDGVEHISKGITNQWQ